MIVQLPGIQPEIAIQAIPDDERVWVPQAPGVWFRPLLLNTVTGSWCNLLRVRKPACCRATSIRPGSPAT
jgi:hypothetical protein